MLADGTEGGIVWSGCALLFPGCDVTCHTKKSSHAFRLISHVPQKGTRQTATVVEHCLLDFPLPFCFSPHLHTSSNSAEVSGSNCLAVVFFSMCHTGALKADTVLAYHLLTLLLIPGTLGMVDYLRPVGSVAAETMLVITSQILIAHSGAVEAERLFHLRPNCTAQASF